MLYVQKNNSSAPLKLSAIGLHSNFMETLTRLYETTHHAATAHHHRILLLSSIVILHHHCSFLRSMIYDLIFVFFREAFFLSLPVFVFCFSEDVFILRHDYGFVKSRNFIARDKYYLSQLNIKSTCLPQVLSESFILLTL